MNNRRPRLAHPFTVLTQPDTVRLVAGEDYRYTLSGARLEQWLPDLLARCTGREPWSAIQTMLPEECRQNAQQLIERLFGERVLVDGPVLAAHVPRYYGRHVAGQGNLCERLRRDLTPDEGTPRITIFSQDNLDYAAALAANRRSREAGMPFLWVSYGTLQRAYVSPLLLHDAGPCFGCMLRTFQRLSPAPDIYDALLEHGRQHQPFAPADFPVEGIDVLHAVVRWKLGQAEAAQPSAALYRLHVVERDTMEVTTHKVFVDPECPECLGGRQ